MGRGLKELRNLISVECDETVRDLSAFEGNVKAERSPHSSRVHDENVQGPLGDSGRRECLTSKVGIAVDESTE